MAIQKERITFNVPESSSIKKGKEYYKASKIIKKSMGSKTALKEAKIVLCNDPKTSLSASWRNSYGRKNQQQNHLIKSTGKTQQKKGIAKIK